MDEVRELIDNSRRCRVGKQELSVALGIDRTTLWKYEGWPETAPEGFWDRYREAIATILNERVALVGAAR